MERPWNGLRWLVVVLGVGLGALFLGTACGGDDDGDVVAIEAALQATVDAWNGAEIEGFLAGFTDSGFMAEFDAPKDAGREFLPDFIGDPPITLGSVEINVSGDTATAKADEFAFGRVLEPTTFSLINQEGAWLIDDAEDFAASIPDETIAVDLVLTEYAFNFDASAITDGNVAFNVSNIGGSEHEVALLAVPDGLDLEEAIGMEGPAEGVSLVGISGPWDPGTDTTLVLTEPLEAGRYAMFCFVEDADGTPHFVLGMVDEFTVQ